MRLGMKLDLRLLLGWTLGAVALAYAQPPVIPPPSAPNTVCADCHDVEAKLTKSMHGKVACASCHLKHEEYPHPEKQPKPACSTCHAQATSDYEQS